jgi:hypothetical protein
MTADIEMGPLHTNDETDPLLIKKSPSSSGQISAPFSLRDLKGPLKAYEELVIKNGGIIESIESTLRSLCYILPGTLPIYWKKAPFLKT